MSVAAKLARIQIGSFRYNSPWTQVSLVGFVCFCSVGMFSAVSGLGAGGLDDVQLSDTANAVLCAMTAVTGFFAGSINNILGPRMTLSIGTTGYSLYIGSLWAYQVHKTGWFVILAGAILGASAALLWSAQGAIMMSYPMEKDKGRSFSLFWTIFQMGTLIGAVIALGIQAHSTLPTVSTGVYLAFMIIQISSIATSWLILPPHLVVRGDGAVVEAQKSLGPREEFRHFTHLFKDWRMIALFPMFFSANYFYAYQGAIIAFLFNPRTRALASLLTGLGGILGSLIVGGLLDKLPGNRRTRSLVTCVLIILLNIAVWSGGLAFQVGFAREDGVRNWDWTIGAAIGPIILVMVYYIADSAFQGLAYYTMSAMSNNPFRLARMAGYYKSVQASGAAVSFGMDAVKTPFLTEHLVSWLMLLFSLPLCFYVLYKTSETNCDIEKPVHVEDLDGAQIHGAALPKSHYAEAQHISGEKEADSEL